MPKDTFIADALAPCDPGMNSRRPSQPLAWALLLAWAVPCSHALERDVEQPLHIVADEVVRDETTGLTTYRGNVQLDQGTIRIEADRITLYRTAGEGDRIVAEGAPAHMQQQPKPDSELMHAQAEIIEYYRAEERVQLRQNARLASDGSTVQGDRIDYFMRRQLVKAVAENGQPQRVEVVIPPHKLPQ